MEGARLAVPRRRAHPDSAAGVRIRGPDGARRTDRIQPVELPRAAPATGRHESRAPRDLHGAGGAADLAAHDVSGGRAGLTGRCKVTRGPVGSGLWAWAWAW